MNIKHLLKLHKTTGIIVFITGIMLHVTSLIIGREQFHKKVFTSTFDMILSIPMTVAGITGLLIWKHVSFDNRIKKPIYGIGIFYLIISIPFHLQTFITGDTGYINSFPSSYSYFVLPVMIFYLVFFSTQVKLKR